MKFFFPDAQDLVDPSFDFDTETRSEHRLRQRDDQYAHEVFATPPYEGMLVSKAIVEGQGIESGRYTMAQRLRLLREGAKEFFRIKDRPLEIMGDCGAFSYVKEKTPPVTPDQVIDFYEACQFDYGVSIDHIILAYNPDCDEALPGLDCVPDDWKERQQITIDLAAEFLARHKKRKCKFCPVGAAQGWSPKSYAHCVEELQKIGYQRIGLGGMVPLKSHEILEALRGIDKVRRPETQFHLFGVTRCDHIASFRSFGVTSFDSTSPLRQAFKDDKDNYYATNRKYAAVRVPQVEGNAKLQKKIIAGDVKQSEARRLELACLQALKDYDRTGKGLEGGLRLLREYEHLYDGKKDYSEQYRATLGDKPWKKCPCEICRAIGIHVVLFRGAERNRRRGFHNLYVTYQRLRTEVQQLEQAG
ncbi:tRNA-guanine transglycosylase DpdA [Gemmata sp. JC717]|uniref:tRNA-guanine transglycosylase DpdA n=1 Tax=Gemmata algarum TaxID=2975278 RepID=UPI0021BB0951|nr:tRNA-guanine transglycosylase DpdA [Gemmata algarum]MDY3551368.1 tRNA-guanine transglycosylase DpdA [Gemmata algarum]